MRRAKMYSAVLLLCGVCMAAWMREPMIAVLCGLLGGMLV